MTTTSLLIVSAVVLVSLAAVKLFPAARHRLETHTADERGIALQTIIIIVVMLAIAGTVATVLLTRAGTETDRLEQETDRWTAITNYTACETLAGGVWTDNDGDGDGDPTTMPEDGTCAPPT